MTDHHHHQDLPEQAVDRTMSTRKSIPRKAKVDAKRARDIATPDRTLQEHTYVPKELPRPRIHPPPFDTLWRPRSNNHINGADPGRFCFLDLPYAIRLMIYEYLPMPVKVTIRLQQAQSLPRTHAYGLKGLDSLSIYHCSVWCSRLKNESQVLRARIASEYNAILALMVRGDMGRRAALSAIEDLLNVAEHPWDPARAIWRLTTGTASVSTADTLEYLPWHTFAKALKDKYMTTAMLLVNRQVNTEFSEVIGKSVDNVVRFPRLGTWSHDRLGEMINAYNSCVPRLSAVRVLILQTHLPRDDLERVLTMLCNSIPHLHALVKVTLIMQNTKQRRRGYCHNHRSLDEVEEDAKVAMETLLGDPVPDVPVRSNWPKNIECLVVVEKGWGRYYSERAGIRMTKVKSDTDGGDVWRRLEGKITWERTMAPSHLGI